MPNPNVGLFSANAAYDGADNDPYGTCEYYVKCLIRACDQNGGYPTCINNKTTTTTWAARCIKDLNNYPFNNAHWNSVAERKIWADRILNELLTGLAKYYSGTWNTYAVCAGAAGGIGECYNEEALPLNSCDAYTTLQWYSYGTNAERATGSIKNCWQCETAPRRCGANSYGLAYYNSGVCTRCPTFNNVSGSSSAGSVSISDCYIPRGQNFTDTTGSYTLNSDCYYLE
ncbi:hypothetical protein HDR63_01585 [bacterium]|nr:hypothetical protein [bacterium]